MPVCLLQRCLLCSAVALQSHIFIHLTFGKHLQFEDGINEMGKQDQVKVTGLALGH